MSADEPDELRFLVCRMYAVLGRHDEAIDWPVSDECNLRLGWNGSPRWATRELIESASPHCGEATLNRLITVLLDHYPLWELPHKDRPSWWGRSQYELLSVIPEFRQSLAVRCVFTLVDEEAEKAAQPPPVPAIDVPQTLDRPHRLVRATRKALGRSQSVVDTRGKPKVIPPYLSRSLADRALRITHALLTEAESRGCTVESQTDLNRGEAVHTVAIVIRGRAFTLVLTERTTKVPHEPTPQELREGERNPWTRLPKHDEEFNGRLALGPPTGSWYQHSYSYSDGARWTLESRLGHLLRDPERLAGEAERREREQELREAE